MYMSCMMMGGALVCALICRYGIIRVCVCVCVESLNVCTDLHPSFPHSCRSFILTSLRQLRTLDDVSITKENTAVAMNTLEAQAKVYTDQLNSIEGDYQTTLSGMCV